MKPEMITYLQSKAKQEFHEKTNHCVQFTNHLWELYHGFEYCPEYNQMVTLRDSKFSNALDAFDAVLERSEKPQEGHLVAVKVPGDTALEGIVIGFCVGDLSVFLNKRGVRYIPTKLVDYSWKNKDARI